MEVLEKSDSSDVSNQDMDPVLLKYAKKRVAFKRHLMTYLIVIGFLWLIWLINGADYPWPIWPMIGWGVAVFIQYVFAYKKGELFSVDDEYKQLKNDLDKNGK